MPDSENGASVLGLVPHQIRGQLSSFSNLILSGNAYSKCTACSSAVIQAYKTGGTEFLDTVWSDSKNVLERVTGITDMLAQTDAALEAIDLDDDDW